MAGYAYQYETSPRKLEPEYEKTKVKKKKNKQKKTVNKTLKTKVKNKKKTQKKTKVSFEVKFFVNSMLVFLMVFAVITCEALVNQRYKEREGLKQQYSELLANKASRTEINENIRTVASEYGMQTKSATLINLETADYIETSKTGIEVETEGAFDKVVDWIKGLF